MPDLPTGRDAADVALVEGWLRGSAEQVDLERGTISTVVYGLTADRRFLGLLDDEGRTRLWRLLEADPGWRVAEEGGVRVAVRRVPVGEDWTVATSGVHMMDGRGFRVAFRDRPWPAESAWGRSQLLVRDAGGEGRIELPSWVVHEAPWYRARASGLCVDVPGLGLDVLEVAPEQGRALTADGVRLAAKAVDAVVDGRDRLERLSGEPAFALLPAGTGALEVRARVATPVPGWTWVRLVTPTGPWQEAAVGRGTRERVGAGPGAWYLQGTFTVPPGPAFEATAEVWLRPDEGETVRVAELPITVPAR
ncbi:MAG: hypothetical protein H6732_13155 [Alphaproteobacteria bacterium]|nr:hypothetical protein [Alphaproteobacteria bacterium]